MQIYSIHAFSNSGGTINIYGDNRRVEISLTNDQAAQVISLAYELLESHKSKLADDILRVTCPALPAPDVIDL